ncbi:biotin--protein ligase 1, chloroplastic-like isoform X3 [Olea europaea var. sylvestris]|uniref:biotin--protein ligase 1, chloroplastic-like isoform X3 n=1 Tax=Olea europaea var. sylvestris TaxID=158386 RepID=UPI000C1D34D7|nr:biotin--protein ligase 1, chloroplastic-like isoform X3 [Olea europaea var. sylvestris]
MLLFIGSPRFLSLPKLIFIPKTILLSVSASKMELESPTTLILCGKSSTENELAMLLKTNNTLKLPENASINVVLHSENEKQESFQKDAFQIDSYMNSLSTSRFGKFLIYSPKLASTHDVVSHNFCELPLGAVCVADVQLKGRGRSKNVWESPKGCLMFSFTLQMEDGRVVPLVQYVVCLAMAEAINDVCLRNGIPPPNVRIKWPNDLYLDGLKVGGILCTSTYRSKKFSVSAGFQALEELYYKTWLHSGQRVIVQEKNENQDQISENVVTIQGITTSGYLLAVTEDGQACELHPDGNSFDFFKGLVRRKLV